MNNPKISSEEPATTTPPPKSRYRFVPRRKRAEEPAEPVSPVQRPSTVIFEASPTTIAASLAKAGAPAPEGTLSWTADVDKAASRELAPPVFVLGGSPSERDLVRNLLDAHPNLSCGSNGEVLADLAQSVTDNWDTLVHQGYPEQHWFRHVAKHFDSIQASQAVSRDKNRWVEFVGDADVAVDTLDRMFPTARIVHLVASGWSLKSTTRAVRSSASRISAGRYLEVRTSDLVTDPEGTVRQILTFLGETA